MGVRERLAERLFGDVISRRVAEAVQVVDDHWWTQIGGAGGTLDRDWAASKSDLDDALEAWRSNPLARRIVALTTDYVVGSGIHVSSSNAWVQSFVDEFWRLNRMDLRCYEWCDELTRAGELFLALRTDAVSGASFVRAIPALQIERVETASDDLERELRYRQVVAGDPEGRWWPSRSTAQGEPDEPILLHYAINRPVGCVRGEGDLAPLLPWLRRYREWLENRVRLNKYKTAFLWDVTVAGRPGQGDALRQKRFRYQSPPEPGSIVVHDDGEKWEAVAPRIEAWDAKEDGRAIRLMVAAGAGVPLHFLSEGESATRATAAEMGDPTFRHYARRQLYFGALLRDLLSVAVERANARGRGRHLADLGLQVQFPDITKEDNVQLAQGALLISQALEVMARHGWIDAQSATQIALRFAGELVDAKEVLRKVKREA